MWLHLTTLDLSAFSRSPGFGYRAITLVAVIHSIVGPAGVNVVVALIDSEVKDVGVDLLGKRGGEGVVRLGMFSFPRGSLRMEVNEKSRDGGGVVVDVREKGFFKYLSDKAIFVSMEKHDPIQIPFLASKYSAIALCYLKGGHRVSTFREDDEFDWAINVVLGIEVAVQANGSAEFSRRGFLAHGFHAVYLAIQCWRCEMD